MMRKRMREERGKTSSSALIYCSHGTSPTLPSVSVALFSGSHQPLCISFSTQNSFKWSKSFHFSPHSFLLLSLHPFLWLRFSNPDKQTLSGLDKMEVCQSPFVTPPFLHPSLPCLPSILSPFSDLSVFPSEMAVEVQRAVCVIRLSVSIKLKYSCARSAPCNNR